MSYSIQNIIGMKAYKRWWTYYFIYQNFSRIKIWLAHCKLVFVLLSR